MTCQTQINLIKEKLVLAKKKDANKSIFGASSHKYKVKKPLSTEEVFAFEKKYNIQLPEGYKTFITQIGNQGKKYPNHVVDKSFAGPFYGVFPLGKKEDYLTEDTRDLAKDCILDQQYIDNWEQNTKKIIDLEDDDDNTINKLFSGILPIGSQGCSGVTGLILNGKNKGKIVYIDEDLQQPIFTYENNFLDWYERWLDEILSDNVRGDLGNFAMTMPIIEDDLFALLSQNPSDEVVVEVLRAVMLLKEISGENSTAIEQLITSENLQIEEYAIYILTGLDYSKAKKHLENYITNEDENIVLFALKAIHWYVKDIDEIDYWSAIIGKRLQSIQLETVLDFSFYILEKSNYDYRNDLVYLCKHQNSEIKRTAFYNVSLLKDNSPFDSIIKEALQTETDVNNLIQVLQSIEKLNNESYIPYYKDLLKKHQDIYITSNCFRLIEELGTNYFDDEIEELLQINFDAISFGEYDNLDVLNALIDFRRIPLPKLLKHATNHPDKEVKKTAKKYLKKLEKKKKKK